MEDFDDYENEDIPEEEYFYGSIFLDDNEEHVA